VRLGAGGGWSLQKVRNANSFEMWLRWDVSEIHTRNRDLALSLVLAQMGLNPGTTVSLRSYVIVGTLPDVKVSLRAQYLINPLPWKAMRKVNSIAYGNESRPASL
jgi:hypothetical protein